jgi:DNA repair protein RAD7
VLNFKLVIIVVCFLQAQGYLSDELDEEQPTSKKRKSARAEALKKGQDKGKRKKKAKDDDDDDYDEDEDAYTALSKSMWSSSSRPSIGNSDICAKCETEFTIVCGLTHQMSGLSRLSQTKYTMAAIPGPGLLCYKCSKATGGDPFKKSAPQRKRKSATDKRTVVNFEERRFPTLVSLCIQVRFASSLPATLPQLSSHTDHQSSHR